MKEMDQLPGLLKQGKEALGAYILILFKLYKRKTVATNEEEKEEKIKYLEEFLEYFFSFQFLEFFSLSINLMANIYSKGEEYCKIIQDRKNKNIIEYPSVESPLRVLQDPYNFEDQVLRDSFMRQSDKLTLLELEKEIMHSRTILSLVLLPKLVEVEPVEVNYFQYFKKLSSLDWTKNKRSNSKLN